MWDSNNFDCTLVVLSCTYTMEFPNVLAISAPVHSIVLKSLTLLKYLFLLTAHGFCSAHPMISSKLTSRRRNDAPPSKVPLLPAMLDDGVTGRKNIKYQLIEKIGGKFEIGDLVAPLQWKFPEQMAPKGQKSADYCAPAALPSLFFWKGRKVVIWLFQCILKLKGRVLYKYITESLWVFFGQ